jgi:hypothetical protein
MQAIYLGVDVAGTTNTWIAALSPAKDGLNFITQPRLSSLKDILAYCEEQNVVAVAIDAQLTIALAEDSGFRISDPAFAPSPPPTAKIGLPRLTL